jgi:hypothetical protein
MSKPSLTNSDFCRAAKRLRCDVAAIKAVASIESAGNGFYGDGFPVILYEKHLFRKFTQGRYNATYPELSGAAGGYGKAGANQIRKFNQAFALNPDAAMKACSWGKFQILGMNHAVCGYKTVGAFVDAMKESEGKQLDAFVSFVIGNKLDAHLRNHDWARFARGYNGAAYAKHGYDIKIGRAYVKFAQENINCNGVAVVAPVVVEESVSTTTEQTAVATSGGEAAISTTTTESQNVVIEAREEEGFVSKIWKKVTGLFAANGALSGVSDYAQQVQAFGLSATFWERILWLAIGATVIYLLYEAYNHWSRIKEAKEKDRLLASVNSTETNTVQFASPENIAKFEEAGYKVIKRK